MAERDQQTGKFLPGNGAARGRGASRIGNQNAVTHGLRSLSRLPSNCNWIATKIRAFRESLQAAVAELRGEVGLIDSATIQTVCRWETHAQLAAKWLHDCHAELTPEARLHFSREVARASAERDKALSMLKLAEDPAEAMARLLYGPVLPMPATSPDASGEPPEPADGAGGGSD